MSSEAAGTTTEHSGGAARGRDARWVAAALVCTLAVAFLAPLWSAVRHPPRVEPEWVVAGLAATAALAVALVGSARASRRFGVRAALGAAAALALFALLCPIADYYSAFGDLPWLVVAPLGLAVVVASWRVHQRWLSVLVVAAALLVAVGATRPPSRQLFPREVRKGDLTVALGGPVRNQGTVSGLLTLTARGKASLDSYDLGSARVAGSSAWGLLPVDAWYTYSRIFGEHTSGRRSLLYMEVFPPRWVRSFHLRLSVPRWPARPAASFRLVVTDKALSTEPAVRSDLPFTVPEARRMTSQEESPGEHGLQVVIALPDSPSGSRQKWATRFRDEKGRVLRSHMTSYTLAGGRWKEEWEVFPRNRQGIITLDIFTQEQMEATRLVFEFRGLPNPADRGPR